MFSHKGAPSATIIHSMHEFLSQLLALPQPDFRNFDEIDYSEIAADDRIDALIEVVNSGAILEDLEDEAADHAIVHAFRALASRREMRFFDLFVTILRAAVVYEDDLLTEDFVKAMTRIGPAAAPRLLSLLHAPGELEPVRTTMIMVLDKLAADGEARETILNSYVEYLAGKHPTRDINAFLTTTLSGHRAADRFPIVRELYANNLINVHIAGDLEEAEVQFGLKKSRTSEKPDFFGLETQLAFEARRSEIGPMPDTKDPSDILAYLLELYQTPDSMESVSQVDGLLHACAASPQLIPPSRLISFIWNSDGDPGRTPSWDSMGDAGMFNQALMDLHNRAVENLQSRIFSPIVIVLGNTPDTVTSFRDWALGALVGVSLWEGDSQPFRNMATGISDALMRVISLESEAREPGQEASETLVKRACDLLVDAYQEVRRPDGPADAVRYFSSRHSHERDSPKIGRNDPCPCGSGKKFKKCCMN